MSSWEENPQIDFSNKKINPTLSSSDISQSPEFWVNSARPWWFLVAWDTQILWLNIDCAKILMETQLRWWTLLLWRVKEEEVARASIWFCLTHVHNLYCSSSKTYKIFSPNICDQIRFPVMFTLNSGLDCNLLFHFQWVIYHGENHFHDKTLIKAKIMNKLIKRIN